VLNLVDHYPDKIDVPALEPVSKLLMEKAMAGVAMNCTPRAALERVIESTVKELDHRIGDPEALLLASAALRLTLWHLGLTMTAILEGGRVNVQEANRSVAQLRTMVIQDLLAKGVTQAAIARGLSYHKADVCRAAYS